jgi:glycerate kinase
MRVLIAPDKFKGTLTARAAAAAIAQGWRKSRPDDSLALLPISDGGDGFGAVMGELLEAKPQQIKTLDAAHRPIAATWWWQPKTKIAVIESANIIGLAMLPKGKFHPFQLDTFGLGKALRTAQRKGARRIIIGIGGSATNDGGFGLARALGWQFLTKAGNQIERWTELEALAHVRPGEKFPAGRVAVAVDVQNPLLGVRGASRVYGPQKGLREQDFIPAERCLRRLAVVLRKQFGSDFAKIPGTGAAGGLGFGLAAFANARLESGFDMFAAQAGLQRQLRTADLIVTGEGRIDGSTNMGKGVGEVARLCLTLRKPCIGLAGTVITTAQTGRLFAQTGALTDLTSVRAATRRPAFWLARAAEKSAVNLVCNRLPRR